MSRVLCAFCRSRPVDPVWRPFCSERCQLQDLARWVDGSYRISAEPVGDEADDPDQSEKLKSKT